MPFLSLTTNLTADDETKTALTRSFTDLIAAELGKPREYVQVLVTTGVTLAFAGTDEPNAFLELRSLGLPTEKLPALSATLSRHLGITLSIPASRVFINFMDLPRTHWGWEGRTFG